MENKNFITTLSKRLKQDSDTTATLVSALTSAITDICSDMDSVAIPGFGTFQPLKTDEHVETDENGLRRLMPPSIKLTFKDSILLRKKLTAGQ